MEPHREKPTEVFILYYSIFQQIVIENIESKKGYKNLPKSWDIIIQRNHLSSSHI